MSRKPFMPPPNWKALYDNVVDFRKSHPAPVDTIGCACLYDAHASKETQRFHILVALMLSAQTKDEVTAAAMKALIAQGLTPQRVRNMRATELDSYISKVGFHNNKAKYIKQVADILLETHDDCVPREYKEVIALPGVGPKMAHLFLQAADGQVMGIGVDTHVHRISQRFGWVPTTVKTPEDTRKALEAWLPKEHWSEINHLLVGLGQTVCTPLRPKCGECELNNMCPNAFKESKEHIATRSQSRSPAGKKKKSFGDIEDTVSESSARKRKRSW